MLGATNELQSQAQVITVLSSNFHEARLERVLKVMEILIDQASCEEEIDEVLRAGILWPLDYSSTCVSCVPPHQHPACLLLINPMTKLGARRW